jgi:hypothetical protein
MAIVIFAASTGTFKRTEMILASVGTVSDIGIPPSVVLCC